MFKKKNATKHFAICFIAVLWRLNLCCTKPRTRQKNVLPTHITNFLIHYLGISCDRKKPRRRATCC